MKVKVEKKSPFIDMTAMSDVTVLLLTFFMLTSTFLQKEPITVITPSSVSEEKVPEQNLVTVLVTTTKDAQGKELPKVFLAVAGGRDTTMSSELMREQIIKNVASAKGLKLTNEQVKTFGSTYMYGQPLSQLQSWLDQPLEKRDELTDPAKNQNAGIPVTMGGNRENPNEFQTWMLAIEKAAGDLDNEDLRQAIRKGQGIAIKADANTPYSIVEVVMDNLQSLKMNKFTLLTALKTEND